MYKFKSFFCLCATLCLVASSCNDKDEDIDGIGNPPRDCYVEVVNANGDDLLDSETENNLWDKGVWAVWNGKYCPIDNQTSWPRRMKAWWWISDNYFLEFFILRNDFVSPTTIGLLWGGNEKEDTIVLDAKDPTVEKWINKGMSIYITITKDKGSSTVSFRLN